MGLFSKKFCDVCGNKIGLLGNRKLEDGNLCKDCAKKLSPWFSERRHSTLNEIKAQLNYRENNKEKVAAFHASKTLGSRTKLMIDNEKRQFMVAKTSNLTQENPDVLDFTQARGCELIIDESRDEIERQTEDGSTVSYDPPRYEYAYTMSVKIFVDHPYFDEMEFEISDGYINTGEVRMGGADTNWTVNRVSSSFLSDREVQKYHDTVALGSEIKAEIDRMQGKPVSMSHEEQIAKANDRGDQPSMGGYAQQGYPQNTAVSTSWVCPFCDTTNHGNFCEGCGAKRPS